MTNSPRIAILPGSYDPMTKGHVALAVRATKLFDRVVVAVMQNDEKKYRFTVDQRLRLAKESVSEIPNCEVIADAGLLIDLYRRLGACCVVKGLRNETDYRYELVQERWNREHLDGFETVYLPSDEEHLGISSTAVREALCREEDIREMLMPRAADLILSGEIDQI